MTKIVLQKEFVQEAMIFDKKTLTERITKLSEEQGELGEAIILQDSNEIVSEAIDNVLVSLSIFLDLSGDINDAELLVNTSFIEGNLTPITTMSKTCIAFTTYSVAIGMLAEAVQKYNSTKTSLYKGALTQSEALAYAKSHLQASSMFLGLISSDISLINDIIDKKNKKWKKNAIKGFLLNSSNSIITHADTASVVSMIKEVAQELDTINFKVFENKVLKHKVATEDDLESLILFGVYNKYLKKDVVVFSNVDAANAETIISHSPSFISICIVNET